MTVPFFSVVVPTYERPRELGLVLEGLRRQEGASFEVVIADDGSGPETARAIDEIRPGFPAPIHHVRQEDEGFRAAAARNRAIERSSGEILVFLDGDCVPLPGFLAAHERGSEPGRYLTGQRMRLDERRSAALDADRISRGHLASFASPRERLRETGERWRALLHRITGRGDRPKTLSCNTSVRRDDVLAINGFDERFVGWGGEDDDFARRLRRSGLRPKSVIGRARILHLYHPPVPSFRGKVRWGPNYEYLHRGYFLTRCRQGLERRSIRDLSIRIADPPGGAAPSPPEPPYEVEVVFSPDPRGASFHPETEIRVLGVTGPGPDPDLVERSHVRLPLDRPGAPTGDAIVDLVLDSLDPLI